MDDDGELGEIEFLRMKRVDNEISQRYPTTYRHFQRLPFVHGVTQRLYSILTPPLPPLPMQMMRTNFAIPISMQSSRR